MSSTTVSNDAARSSRWRERVSQASFVLAVLILQGIAFGMLDSASEYDGRNHELDLGRAGLFVAAFSGAIAIGGLYKLWLRARFLSAALVTVLPYTPLLTVATAATYLVVQSFAWL